MSSVLRLVSFANSESYYIQKEKILKFSKDRIFDLHASFSLNSLTSSSKEVYVFLFLCLKYSHEKQLNFTKQFLYLFGFFIDALPHLICSLKIIWENIYSIIWKKIFVTAKINDWV